MSLTSKLMEAIVRYLPAAKPDPMIQQLGSIGRPLARVDAPVKVRGEATFTAEHNVGDLVYAALVHSTIPRGRVLRIETSGAESQPGVLAVITHANMPRLKTPEIWSVVDVKKVSASDLPVLQDESVSWNGQVIAIVVADTQERAEEAASRIRVEYETEEAKLSFDQHRADSVVPPNVLGEPSQVKIGDAQEALAAAEVRVDQAYRTPYYNHNAIEPHATIAIWTDDESLTVLDSTQSIIGFQHSLAQIFDLPPDSVRVICPFIGGAFGGKVNLWTHTVLCAAVAKVVNRPVKLVLRRDSVFRLVGGRTLSSQRIALGASRQGKLQSVIHQVETVTPEHARYAEQATFPVRHLYGSEAFLIEQRVVNLHMVANTWMRAPGESIGMFALESAIDELAYELSIDPLEVRRLNEPERDPTKGTPFSSRRLIEATELGAERFKWHSRTRTLATQRDGKWRIGQGMAYAFYPFWRFPAKARVRLTAEGEALIQAAAQELGTGVATTQLQHAADRLGLSIDQVTFHYGDSRLPDSPPAGGSAQTASITAAVRAAIDSLHRTLIDLVKNDKSSPLYGVDYKGVEARDGGLFRTDSPATGESYAAILRRVGRDYVEESADAPMPLEIMQFSMASYGAHFCEVRVHQDTGEVRVTRWVAAIDCGAVLNPKIASSVIRGGIVMGIGMALTEETLFDERLGRVMNASLAEYHVPVNLDVPSIDVLFTGVPDQHAPLGARGIGEIGITGVAAAVANAVFHATGKRIRNLPITLDKLL